MARLTWPSGTRRVLVAAVAGLCATGALAGCQVQGLQFRADDRLRFVEPRARHRVSVPFDVSWTMRGFVPSGLDGSADRGRGVFAVFVDRAPMPVGKDLRWLFRDDTGCKRDPRCPDVGRLKDRGVLLTADDHVTIDVLPATGEGRGDELHFVNVVLLDGQGRRSGESAWYLPFTSRRRSA